MHTLQLTHTHTFEYTLQQIRNSHQNTNVVKAFSLLIMIHMIIYVKKIRDERWGAGVETQKNVRGEIGGWGRVTFNEPYAPSLSTIYDGA